MDAAPQRCLWLLGLSSRAADSSYAGSMDLIKTQSVGHLFARDDASSHVLLPAPGGGGGGVPGALLGSRHFLIAAVLQISPPFFPLCLKQRG